MHINHHGVEFGYELIAVLPFAYWLHLNGKLSSTTSHEDTKCLYYFSENHKEDLKTRHSRHVRTCISEKQIPNIKLHYKELDWSRWTPPPYKEVYENNEFDFDVVVTNKYNREWGRSPVNYFSPDMLDKIFSSLKGNVLYFHMTSDFGRDDTVPSLELNEWDVVNSHSNVTTMQKLIKTSKYSLNETQLRLYSNCNQFITLQGGSSIFASYFGGRNLIYATRGTELKVGAYNWYHKLGGSEIVVAQTYKDLLNAI